MNSFQHAPAGGVPVAHIPDDLGVRLDGDSLCDQIFADHIDESPPSRRMLEGILAKEEEHADDMKTLLERVGKEETERQKK